MGGKGKEGSARHTLVPGMLPFPPKPSWSTNQSIEPPELTNRLTHQSTHLSILSSSNNLNSPPNRPHQPTPLSPTNQATKTHTTHAYHAVQIVDVGEHVVVLDLGHDAADDGGDHEDEERREAVLHRLRWFVVVIVVRCWLGGCLGAWLVN